jgi:ATPase subunit of ABC transporter with duplicated ATPase domains
VAYDNTIGRVGEAKMIAWIIALILFICLIAVIVEFYLRSKEINLLKIHYEKVLKEADERKKRYEDEKALKEQALKETDKWKKRYKNALQKANEWKKRYEKLEERERKRLTKSKNYFKGREWKRYVHGVSGKRGIRYNRVKGKYNIC